MCLVYLFVFHKNFQFYFTFFKTPEGGSVVWLVPLLPYPFGAPFILCYVYPLKVSDEFVHNKLEWWLNVFHHFFFPGFLNEASEEVSILENLVRWKSILHLNNDDESPWQKFSSVSMWSRRWRLVAQVFTTVYYVNKFSTELIQSLATLIYKLKRPLSSVDICLEIVYVEIIHIV